MLSNYNFSVVLVFKQYLPANRKRGSLNASGVYSLEVCLYTQIHLQMQCIFMGVDK